MTARLGDDVPDVVPRHLKLYAVHEVDLVQDDDIRHADLMDGQGLMAAVEAQGLFGVDHGEDAVNAHAPGRPKGKRDFERIRDAAGFNDDVFGRLRPLEQVEGGFEKVVTGMGWRADFWFKTDSLSFSSC